MTFFKKKDAWSETAAQSLEFTYQELQHMHQMLREWDDNYIYLNMTKNELFDRIMKFQDTLIEATRRLCGLEY